MRYGYYPGCSMPHSAAPYEISTQAVVKALGVGLEELDDWNCCGATEYIALNKIAAYALVGRNLALAERQFCTPGDGKATIVAPCSACCLNLTKVEHNMEVHPELAKKVNLALAEGGLSHRPGTIDVKHLLEVVCDDVGLAAVKAKVVKPLRGLRVAPYYGCLLTRPVLPGHPTDDPEYPTSLDDLLKALGAEVVDFPLKTHCCGGHMTQISAETANSLIYRLLRSASEYDADAVVVICPMCQLNLDAYQSGVNRQYGTTFELPVLYFTQLMGLAFGIEAEELGLGREITPARNALAKIGVAEPQPRPAEPPKPARRAKGDKRLPMPVLPGSDRGGEA